VSLTSHQAPRRDLALLWHQIRYEQLSFWRNPQSAFFTFLFPVVLIAIFGVLFRGASGSSYFYGLSALQYYVPTIAALSVLGSCYSQLAIVLAMRRQDGILKRVRATYTPIHSAVLNRVSGALPVRPFNQALMNPFAQHAGPGWTNLGVLLAWGAAGALVAVRRFRWDPRPE
jgi:ABC-2 type transport system permease protein